MLLNWPGNSQLILSQSRCDAMNYTPPSSSGNCLCMSMRRGGKEYLSHPFNIFSISQLSVNFHTEIFGMHLETSLTNVTENSCFSSKIICIAQEENQMNCLSRHQKTAAHLKEIFYINIFLLCHFVPLIAPPPPPPQV